MIKERFSGSCQNISNSENFESKRVLLANKRPGALSNQHVLLSFAFISKACIHISDIFYKCSMSSASRNSSREGGSPNHWKRNIQPKLHTACKNLSSEPIWSLWAPSVATWAAYILRHFVLLYTPEKTNMDTQNYALENVTPALNITFFWLCYISGGQPFFCYFSPKEYYSAGPFFLCSQLEGHPARFSHASWSRRSHVACA